MEFIKIIYLFLIIWIIICIFNAYLHIVDTYNLVIYHKIYNTKIYIYKIIIKLYEIYIILYVRTDLR